MYWLPPIFQEQPREGAGEVRAVLSDERADARHDAAAHHHAAQPLLQGRQGPPTPDQGMIDDANVTYAKLVPRLREFGWVNQQTKTFARPPDMQP